MDKKLIVIGGPTASGKTSLSIQLAEHFNTEIISADSRQFYKELNIGTAKPTAEELAKVKHHFINSHSITEHLNSGTYAIEAENVLNRLFENNDVVILVGGSGLYINSLLNGLDNLPDVNSEMRVKLKDDFKEYGINFLLDELKKSDPEYFELVDHKNHQRMMRALEIIRTTGNSYSSYLGKRNKNNNFQTHCFVIDYPREELYERINTRVDQMIEQGLLEEVKSLISYRHQASLQTVGYKEIFEFIDGSHPFDKAIELIKQHSRNYAKRQLTWFRHQGDFQFLNPSKNPCEKISTIV